MYPRIGNADLVQKGSSAGYSTIQGTVQYSSAYSTVKGTVQFRVQYRVHYCRGYNTVQYMVQYSTWYTTVHDTLHYRVQYDTVQMHIHKYIRNRIPGTCPLIPRSLPREKVDDMLKINLP